MTRAKTECRPDIDGLRAVAVLSVVAYHYGVPGVPGGFTGVDIFFVISGYLISSIIRRDLELGRFSFIAFYERRIRRIVPALVTVLLASTLVGYFVLWPEDYMWFAWSAVTAAVGGSNFFFARHINYFSQAAEVMPLLHTWSLGIEEQFYLVWPLLLMVLARWLKSLLVPVLVLVVVVSFCAALGESRHLPSSAFYMLPFRAWELALGGVLAYLPVMPGRLAPALRVSGLVFVASSILLVAVGMPFPAPFAAPACLGAALLVWPASRSGLFGQTLGRLAIIGRVSYSLYLWHWPVISFYRNYKNAVALSPLELLFLLLLAIVLSVLSYRYVERPFRAGRVTRRQVFGWGIVAVATVFGLGLVTALTGGWGMRLAAKDRPLQNIQAMWEWPCPQWVSLGAAGETYCSFGASWDAADNRVVVWGDSHAQHLAPLLHAVARGTSTSFVLAGQCSAVAGRSVHVSGDPSYRDVCRNSRAEVVRLLGSDPKIHGLVLAAAWSSVTGKLYEDQYRPLPATEADALLFKGLDELVKEVARPDLDVTIVADNPFLPEGVAPICAIDQNFLMREAAACRQPQTGVSRSEYDAVNGGIDAVFARLATTNPNTRLHVQAERLCASGTCMIELDGEFLYRDASHYRRNLLPGTNLDLGRLLGLDQLIR